MSDATNPPTGDQTPSAAPVPPPAAPQAAPAYAPPAYPPPAYGAPQAPSAHAPYGQAPYGQAPYGTPAYGAPARTNTLAIISLIASIAGLTVIPFLGSLAGAILGHLALKQIGTSGEAGRGMALAGVIVGWVGVGFVVLVFGFILVMWLFVAAGTGYSSI